MESIKETLKRVAGRAAEIALPGLAREIDENRNRDRAAFLKRAIIQARLHRAKSRGDVAAVDKALSSFWKGHSGDRFHAGHAAARFRLFREQHATVIDELDAQLEASMARFGRIVEIGCGDGQVLDYCCERLPWVSSAVGLDINATVIAQNAARQDPGGKIAFVAADAGEWLAAHPEPGTALLSNGGVLEYFSPAKVDGLFQSMAASRPAAVVLVEPVAPGHDLNAETGSRIFGRENSFSHNHAYRLEKAGFKVAYRKEIRSGGIRWMLMIGLLA